MQNDLIILVLGALMGILGQGSRAVVGLKGMSDDAKALNKSPDDLFEASRLLTSLFIGLLVGLAAALIYIIKNGTGAEVTPEVLIGFAASGYVGVDFLEGFIAQYLPAGSKPVAQAVPDAAGQGFKPAAFVGALATTPDPTPATPKQLVYSVILQLEPNEQPTDDTPLQNLGFDDVESKDILRWAIDKRQWHGVNLPVWALSNCTKVSDVTLAVTKAVPKVTPPNAQPKAAPPNANQQNANPVPATS
jgi:hypothetical protein